MVNLVEILRIWRKQRSFDYTLKEVVNQIPEELSQWAAWNIGEGLRLERDGNIGAAIYYFKRAVELNPTGIQEMFYLGRAYAKSDLVDEAINWLERTTKEPEERLKGFVSFKPEIGKVYLLLGDLLHQQGRYHEAAIAYDKHPELETIALKGQAFRDAFNEMVRQEAIKQGLLDNENDR
ncbi:hypothetical protein HYX02_05690 [Candidatus Woesearchaeota archaeon]|nr:hypothetical protein [Candidatus Woesearchaeota archaeon]